MFGRNSADTAENKWKKKYYDSLDELEKKEKQWEEKEKILRQGISRLTLAADDRDNELNAQLDSLRKIIRKDKDHTAIKRALDEVSNSILNLDRIKVEEKQLGDSYSTLLLLLKALEFDKKQAKSVHQLQKKLEKKQSLEESCDLFLELIETRANHSNDNTKTVEESATSAVDNVKENFTQAESDSSLSIADIAGLLLNFFEDIHLPKVYLDTIRDALLRTHDQVGLQNTLNQTARTLIDYYTEKAQPAQEVVSDDKASVIPTEAKESNKETARHQDIHLAKQFQPHEVLIRLLECIPLQTEEILEKVSTVKQMLTQGIPPVALNDALFSVADIVAGLHPDNKLELKEFLQSVTERLGEVEKYLQTDMDDQQQLDVQRETLNHHIQQQIQDIGKSVSSTKNIRLLEKNVQGYLDSIVEAMSKHREVEKQRIERAETQLSSMQKKLQAMEEEADELRSSIINAQERALFDPLTSLYNRMAYNERVNIEYTRWKRYQSHLVLMIGDIDFFKKVNDTYGHLAGDKVLKIVAQVFKNNLREADFIARFGGEEFIVIMPETQLKSAFIVAEKLRKAIFNLDFHYRGSQVKMSISLGIAQFSQEDTIDSVFERADKALYKAKTSGRNRCCTEAEITG